MTFKLPSNVEYRIFDKHFEASSGKYMTQNKNSSLCATENEAIKNRNAICEEIGAKHIVILDQVHGTEIHYATRSTDIGLEPVADACYTDQKNIALCIRTADCVPVLIADDKGKVIGAAHCGWKSAVAGILQKLIIKMENAGGEKFVAIVGPSISQESYEVDNAYYERFLEEDIENARFFIPSQKNDHFLFDISGYVISKLNLLGVTDVHHIKEDTYSNADKYPSYRRHCHTNEEYKSSIVSAIAIKTYTNK